MPTGLQVLDQQPFGPLDRDRKPCAKPAELLVELGQPGDVMGQADLASPGAGGVDHAQLVVAAAPVDADEHLLPVGVYWCLHRVLLPRAATPGRARLDAHLGARSTTPTGQCQARRRRE